MGAGFFGSGPFVEFCEYCRGTGVMIDESRTPQPKPKPVRRERRRTPRVRTRKPIERMIEEHGVKYRSLRRPSIQERSRLRFTQAPRRIASSFGAAQP